MRFIGNAPVDGEVRAIASGALATGDTVLVNSDGTVSVVEETNVSQSVGSATVYRAASFLSENKVVYDSANGKIVITYRDVSNNSYLTAVVGEVSGTSISFGTPVVINSQNTSYGSPVYDPVAQKIVVSYMQGTDGYAVIGTVSGTSISFGTRVNFASGGYIAHQSIIYDSPNNKVVIFFRDGGNNEYGTAIVGTVSGTSISFGSKSVFHQVSAPLDYPISSTYDASNNKIVITYKAGGSDGYAVVGEVSGTSISFGSPTVYDSGHANIPNVVYDEVSGKVVFAYQDQQNSNRGTAIVGTVSGTSISFGSKVVFETGATYDIAMVYDKTAKKIVIAFADDGDSYYGKFILCTVSGNTPSFSSLTLFNLGNSPDIGIGYDSGQRKVVIAYRNNANSGYGSATVLQNAASIPNLTSENFVGFANSGYASGQSAALNSTCSVDKNQSGLTAGETYYVQTDGTLGTTPADPSVLAGTAISSNSIVVKG